VHVGPDPWAAARAGVDDRPGFAGVTPGHIGGAAVPSAALATGLVRIANSIGNGFTSATDIALSFSP